MILFFSCFLIPAITAAMAFSGELLTSNLSVAGSEMPGRLFLIFWALVTGGYFRFAIKRIVGQASPYLSAKRELFLTDLAVFLLMISVCIPYRPEKSPVLSGLHVILAFFASVFYFLILLSLDLKLYFLHPKSFSGPTAALFYSVFAAAAIFYAADYIITTLLEISVTVFSSFLLFFLWKKTASQAE